MDLCHTELSRGAMCSSGELVTQMGKADINCPTRSQRRLENSDPTAHGLHKLMVSEQRLGACPDTQISQHLRAATEHGTSTSLSSFSEAASTLLHGGADTTLKTTLKTLPCNAVSKHRKQQLAVLPGKFVCQ